jgi:cytochrome c556
VQHRWLVKATLIPLLVVAACVQVTPVETVGPAQSDDDALERRMMRHADELALLRLAVSTGDFDGAVAAARLILTEPLFDQPSAPLEASPARFLALQERMFAATREVEAAAELRDPDALDDAFDALTATCRSCHAQHRARRR